MKETLITRGMIQSGLIKPGQRVRTRFGESEGGTTYLGTVNDIKYEDIIIAYDDGDMDALYIPGFSEDATEEEQATQRLYILDGEPDAASSNGLTGSLYMLLDVQSNRILRKDATLECIRDYALADYRKTGSTNRLVIVSAADVKPVELGVMV